MEETLMLDVRSDLISQLKLFLTYFLKPQSDRADCVSNEAVGVPPVMNFPGQVAPKLLTVPGGRHAGKKFSARSPYLHLDTPGLQQSGT